MTYDLKSISLPTLGPGGIRALNVLAGNVLVGNTLIGKLRKDAGLSTLTEEPLDDAPTFTPQLANAAPSFAALDPRMDDARAGFRFPTVADYHAAYRTAALTPVDIAERFLARWKESEQASPALRGFISMRSDDILAQARASADRWKSGKPIGPFDGVPIAAKDEIDQAGYVTTIGTKLFDGAAPAARDSTAVARMRAAGAVTSASAAR